MSKLEMWMPVEGYEEFYEVSDLGRVKQLEAWRTWENGTEKYYEEKILKPYVGKCNDKRFGGYLRVSLVGANTNEREVKYVHSLVATAFCEKPRGYKTEVNHIDRNKLNNDSKNLEWITHKENMIHWRES